MIVRVKVPDSDAGWVSERYLQAYSWRIDSSGRLTVFGPFEPLAEYPDGRWLSVRQEEEK